METLFVHRIIKSNLTRVYKYQRTKLASLFYSSNSAGSEALAGPLPPAIELPPSEGHEQSALH